MDLLKSVLGLADKVKQQFDVGNAGSVANKIMLGPVGNALVKSQELSNKYNVPYKMAAPLLKYAGEAVNSAAAAVPASIESIIQKKPFYETFSARYKPMFYSQDELNTKLGDRGKIVKTGADAALKAASLATAVYQPATAVQAMTLGAAPKAVTNIFQGKPITEGVGKAAEEGLNTAAILAVTNKATDLALTKVAGTLESIMPSLSKNLMGVVPENVNAPFKYAQTALTKAAQNKAFQMGARRSIERALLEVPFESLAFGTKETLTQDEKKSWAKNVVEQIPANIIGNLAFAGLNVGAQGANIYTKDFREELQKAITNTFQRMKNDQRGFINPSAKINPSDIENAQAVRNAKYQKALLEQKDKTDYPDYLEKLNKPNKDSTDIALMDALAEKWKDDPRFAQHKAMATDTTTKIPEPAVATDTTTPKVEPNIDLNKPNTTGGTVDQTFKTEKFDVTPDEQARLVKLQNALGLSTREVRTFDDMKEMAEVLGMDPQKLLQEVKQNRITDAEVVALGNVISTSTSRISDLTKQLQADPTNVKLQGALDRESQLLEAAISKRIKGGTEAGRAVAAFRIIANRNLDPAYWITKARKQMGNKPLPDEAVTAISDLIGKQDRLGLAMFVGNLGESSTVDKLITLWKAGLLTSFRTTERNLLGNSIHQGAEIAKDYIAAPFDKVLSLRTGQRSMTPTVQGMQEFTSKSTRDQFKEIVKTGYDPASDISKYDIKKVRWGDNPVEQAAKKYTDFVFNLLGAEDKPFYNAAYARSLYDQAGAAAINAGKSGDKEFIKGLVTAPTPEMTATAIKEANIATFHDQNKMGQVMSGLKRLLATPIAGDKSGKAGQIQAEFGKLIGETALPFTGVPSSILGQVVNYSPIGLVKGIFNASKVLIKDVPELQRQAVQELGRGVMGTGLFGIGAFLADKGLITGQPKDAKEAYQWQLEGKQANSVLIGGKWRSIGSIGPENLVILAGAKYAEDTGNPDSSAGQYLAGLGKDYLDQSLLKGVNAPINAISDPARFGNQYIEGMAGSVVPNIIKDVSKTTDIYQRDTNGAGDAFRQGLPLFRNALPIKTDVIGNPLAQEPSGPMAMVDLFNSKTPIQDPVVAELARLNNAGFNAAPSKPSKEQTIAGNKMVLTPEELSSLQQQTAPYLMSALGDLFNNPDYQKLPDEEKANSVGKVVTAVRKKVRAIADVTGMPDAGYVHSKDAPQNIIEGVGTYGNAVLTDPVSTIKAIINGNPVRRVTGDAVILERQNQLGSLDKGDKTTQVDHIVPLSLGGTNDKSNLQIISAQENAAKAKVEVYLGGLLKDKKITKEEAQKRVLSWKDEIKNLSTAQQKSLMSELQAMPSTTMPQDQPTDDLHKTYQLVDEKGNVTSVDLAEPLEAPKLTGNSVIDKTLISKYKSSITSRKNNIVKLFEAGKLTQQQAETLLAELPNGGSTAKGKGKTAKQKAAALKKVYSSMPKITAARATVKPITVNQLMRNTGQTVGSGTRVSPTLSSPTPLSRLSFGPSQAGANNTKPISASQLNLAKARSLVTAVRGGGSLEKVPTTISRSTVRR